MDLWSKLEGLELTPEMEKMAEAIHELRTEFERDFESATNQQQRTPSSSTNVAYLFDLVGRLRDIQDAESEFFLKALQSRSKGE